MVLSDYFVCESANFNPKIKVPLFLDSAEAGLLENVQTPFSRHLGSQDIAKQRGDPFFLTHPVANLANLTNLATSRHARKLKFGTATH